MPAASYESKLRSEAASRALERLAFLCGSGEDCPRQARQPRSAASASGAAIGTSVVIRELGDPASVGSRVPRKDGYTPESDSVQSRGRPACLSARGPKLGAQRFVFSFLRPLGPA